MNNGALEKKGSDPKENTYGHWYRRRAGYVWVQHGIQCCYDKKKSTYFCPYGGECRYCLEAQERARMDEELSPTIDGGSAWSSSDGDWDVDPEYAGGQASDVPASWDPWWGADWWDAALQWAWEQPNPDENSTPGTPKYESTDPMVSLPKTMDGLVDLCLEKGLTTRKGIQEFLMDIPGGAWFDLMIGLGSQHQLFDEFQCHIKEFFGLCDSEWYFGDDDGDKLEDLVDLCNFLVKRKGLIPTSPQRWRDVMTSPQKLDEALDAELGSCGDLGMHAGNSVYSDLWGDSGLIHLDFQNLL